MTLIVFFIILNIAVIWCGIISGIFLAFSDFVMRSLKIAKTEAGIEVMQIINREVWRSIFMWLLWGMVVVSTALSTYAYFNIVGLASTLVITGGLLYFFGMLVVSFTRNIPMNDKLETMDYSGTKAATYWHSIYVQRWVRWNYIRAITSGGAAICFLIASLLLTKDFI